MTEHTKDPLELLANAARYHAKAAPSADRLDAQVTQALLASNATALRRERIRVFTGYAIAAAVLLAFLGRDYWRAGSTEQSTTATPRAAESIATSRSVLATGDILTTTIGGDVDMSAFTESERRVRVSSGTVLFDVRHLQDNVPFVVETHDARVVVRGTVFSVGIEAGVTRVHVFEGRVDLVRADGSHSLTAGMRMTSTPAGDRIAWVSPLRDAGESAARARATQASDVRAALRTATNDTAAVAVEATSAGTENVRAGVSLARTEASVAAGDFDAARAACERMDRASGAWLLVCADAQRGLGEFADAARLYEAAAHRLSPSRATLAGVSAARIHLDRLHDASAALRAITGSRADESGSPVEEPAFVIRLRALDALDRREELQRLVSVYLARFPDGSARAWAESLSTRATSAPHE